MGNYVHRAVDAVLGSALLPVFARMGLMRALGFKLGKNACIWSGASLRSKKIRLGDRVFINVGFFYDGDADVVVGDNVRMGQFVRIITATHDIGPPEQRCTIQSIAKPVTIEEGCWIGTGVTILPGVIIRRGCVIGAGSLVTASTERDGLYMGSPAKRVRDLPAGSETRVPAEAL